jgi:hypothetical protein
MSARVTRSLPRRISDRSIWPGRVIDDAAPERELARGILLHGGGHVLTAVPRRPPMSVVQFDAAGS